ncbi:hypothetical protein GCM10022630_34020 [Thermobifida alba]
MVASQTHRDTSIRGSFSPVAVAAAVCGHDRNRRSLPSTSHPGVDRRHRERSVAFRDDDTAAKGYSPTEWYNETKWRKFRLLSAPESIMPPLSGAENHRLRHFCPPGG